MSSHRVLRGWAFALLTLATAIATPAWAACNNPKPKIDPDNQTVPERTGSTFTVVTLDGSKSTPNNEADMRWQWEYLGSTPAGLSVTLSSATAEKPTFTAPDVGINGAALRFRLTVRCLNNPPANPPVETTINVTNVLVNSPPTASFFFSPLDASEGQTVTLNGTG